MIHHKGKGRSLRKPRLVTFSVSAQYYGEIGMKLCADENELCISYVTKSTTFKVIYFRFNRNTGNIYLTLDSFDEYGLTSVKWKTFPFKVWGDIPALLIQLNDIKCTVANKTSARVS